MIPRGRFRRVLAAGISTGVISGCEGPRVQVHRTLTSTVALQSIGTFDLSSVLPFSILGEFGRSTALVEVDATVTASSAATAQALADALTLPSSQPAPGTVLVSIASPRGGTLGGRVSIRLPQSLAFQGQSTGATAEARSITGPVILFALTGAKMTDAQSDVQISVQNGPAIVDTRAIAGTNIVVEVVSGDIELDLPAVPSIAIDAQIDGGATVRINHPGLPKQTNFNQGHYTATVNGGFAHARLHTQLGQIVINPR